MPGGFSDLEAIQKEKKQKEEAERLEAQTESSKKPPVMFQGPRINFMLMCPGVPLSKAGLYTPKKNK